MSDNQIDYQLAPAGYLIVQDADQARTDNTYRNDFGPYFGVDRLPPIPPPNLEIRRVMGEKPVQDDVLAMTIDEWLDSPFGTTGFIPHFSQVLRLFELFQRYGYLHELVYCQVAWMQGEDRRLCAYPTTNESPPTIATTYGFDVSWPNCKHSAILQPGVVSSSVAWREKLNQYGLLNHYADAVRLRQEYLAVYPYPPFDIYIVHAIQPSLLHKPD